MQIEVQWSHFEPGRQASLRDSIGAKVVKLASRFIKTCPLVFRVFFLLILIDVPPPSLGSISLHHIQEERETGITMILPLFLLPSEACVTIETDRERHEGAAKEEGTSQKVFMFLFICAHLHMRKRVYNCYHQTNPPHVRHPKQSSTDRQRLSGQLQLLPIMYIHVESSLLCKLTAAVAECKKGPPWPADSPLVSRGGLLQLILSGRVLSKTSYCKVCGVNHQPMHL